MFSKLACSFCRNVRFYSGDVSRTALYNFHVQNGGKMIDFGGFMLPVQYNDQSIINSHLFTRKSASLFDVSHMLQTEILGNDCSDYLESLCTADLKSLQKDTSALTVFTNEKGGILDDLIVTKIEEDHLFVVSNAARKNHDQNLLKQALNKHKALHPKSNTKLHFFDPMERSLIALQGPKAAEILQKVTNVDLTSIFFMKSIPASVCGVELCRITRCGYTGEDGFEISVPSLKIVDVANELIKNSDVKLAGLGARDSLRLEAGLCLYGNDITEETTPVEAGLTWLVAKSRRERCNFPGGDVILNQIKVGSIIKRVGLMTEAGPPPRQGAVILDKNGGKILGGVTSGCPSPTLTKNIAMGYVPVEFSKIGNELTLKIREKIYPAKVVKMPFVPAKYYNKKN
nr:aminomethyltransferase, mitochondrial [Onthophagus taurus]